MIKTFRGNLANDGQDHIRLSTKKGKVGYRIIKLEIMPVDANTTTEAVVKIFKITQTSVTTAIDFSDGNLLAAVVINDSTDPGQPPSTAIMFEHEIFNQDIFITQKGHDATPNINYYLEIETMPLTDNAAAVSTLRDIRLNPQVGA
jgi:hypothetical protein